jgi:hypothetical protein
MLINISFDSLQADDAVSSSQTGGFLSPDMMFLLRVLVLFSPVQHDVCERVP